MAGALPFAQLSCSRWNLASRNPRTKLPFTATPSRRPFEGTVVISGLRTPFVHFPDIDAGKLAFYLRGQWGRTCLTLGDFPTTRVVGIEIRACLKFAILFNREKAKLHCPTSPHLFF